MTTFSQNYNKLVEQTLQENHPIKTEQETEMNKENDKVLNIVESAKSQGFFQDNKGAKIKYTATRIKSRNFLSNIIYMEMNKEDYYNKNFYFDVYLL